MPVPIRWKCCVPGCDYRSLFLARVAKHELTHFEPSYKEGDVVGRFTVLGTHVVRTIAGPSAKLMHRVEFDFWKDGNLARASYSAKSLAEEEELAKKGRSLLD